MEKIKNTRMVDYYTIICSVCGEEIEVQKYSNITMCWKCANETKNSRARQILNDIFHDCKVVSVEPVFYGGGEPNYYIRNIIVQNDNGEKFKLFTFSDLPYIAYRKLEKEPEIINYNKNDKI